MICKYLAIRGESLPENKGDAVFQHFKIYFRDKKKTINLVFKYSRRFTPDEKNILTSNYKQRCLTVKDYRFCVSYAAYILGDRTIRDLTHTWTYINPEIQKGKFKPEEDALLLEHVKLSPSFCWTAIAANYLPNRSPYQCRKRYLLLIRRQSTQTTQKTKKSKKKRGR